MPYRIGNLLVTIVPRGFPIELLEPDDGGLPPGGLPPQPPEPPPPPGPDQFTLDPRFDILEMRYLLQLALAQLGGPLTAEEVRPRMVGDLDELEGRLTEALEEVQVLRERFG
jgi:hypothetical protein